MARERAVLTVQQYKEMAREHCTQMNQLIQTQNQKIKDTHRQHLGHFVYEALGQMGAQELIVEYEATMRRQTEIQSRFARLMGKNITVGTFLTSNRENMLDQVFRHDSRLGENLYRELEVVLARHGVNPSEATQIPLVQEKDVLDKLRECRTTDEVKLVIMQSQMRVIQSLGIELPPKKPVQTHEGSTDGTV
jgi:hypothetical protein